MKAAERRQLILERLDQTQKPLSASYLAKELGVSRQAIVGDVALLRANHHGILSTHRGYLLEKKSLLPSAVYRQDCLPARRRRC